jgi:hypothetical protein
MARVRAVRPEAEVAAKVAARARAPAALQGRAATVDRTVVLPA